MSTTDFTDGVTLTAAAWFDDVDCSAYSVLSGVAGTNTITATGPATYSYAATRPPVWFIPAATNTGATTVNITPSGGAALGAKNVFFRGVACTGGELQIGVPVGIVYDGTQFSIVGPFTGGRLGTEVATTSGTSIDFTGFPPWVKRISIMPNGVSTNGTSILAAQLGDTDGIEVTGYIGTAILIVNASTPAATSSSTRFVLSAGTTVADLYTGTIVLTLENAATNTWTMTSSLSREAASAVFSAGSKSLSAVLDRVRITTVNGTDAFDAGSINVSYE